MTISVTPITFLGFSMTPSGSLRLTSYEAQAMIRRREAHTLSLSISRPGMEVSYAYQEVNGESPFAFDHLIAKNHIAFSLVTGSRLALRVSGGIDLANSSFDPLQLRADWSPKAKFSLSASYNIPTAAFTSVDLSGDMKSNDLSVQWDVPYDVTEGRFKVSALKFQAGSSHEAALSLSGEFDLNKVEISSLILDARMVYGANFGISLGGKLDVKTQSIVDPRFGLFYDFYDCLRVGIERRSGQVWVYTSILAFPEAVLRYAPSSTQVKLGK
jgi:hypothetical protein